MDSGNSGSMQSSSGGDDEYDSRAESISALLGGSTPSQLGPMSNNPPLHHHSNHLDPLSNIFDTRFTNPNPLMNFDMVWSKTLRSDPNAADLGGLIPSSSPSSHNQMSQPFLTNNQNNSTIQLGGPQSRGSVGGGRPSSTFAALQIPHDHQNIPASSSAPSNQANTTTNINNGGGIRNSKKRSRASRRAPTTVLTTDTTNFRAMVQEFTGIPAPPFTSSSPFPRSRLDLFGTAAASSFMRGGGGGGAGGGVGGGGLGLDPSPPPYLLRPFAHKAAHQPPTSSMVDQNLLNMQNQSQSSSSSVLNFQSLFQPQQNPKFTNSPSLLSSKPPPHQQGSSDHFGLSHPQQLLNMHPNNNNHHLVSSSDGGLSRHDTTNADHQGLMRSINGSFSGGSSSNIGQGDKAGGQDQNNATNTTRCEGMVESWICSSD